MVTFLVGLVYSFIWFGMVGRGYVMNVSRSYVMTVGRVHCNPGYMTDPQVIL